MRQWRLWTLATWLALGASAAVAQSPGDAVVEQLRGQGYVEFEVSRTLLGRTRVVALAPDGGWREIVVNPGTGEILRDYFEAADGSRAPVVLDRSDDDLSVGRPSVPGKPDDNDEPPPANSQDNRPSPRQDDIPSPPQDDRPSPRQDDMPGPSRSGQERAGARGVAP